MVTSGRSHPRTTALVVVQVLVWLALALAAPALSDDVCPAVANPSVDCAFDVTNIFTVLRPPAVVQRLITTVCTAGAAANCSSHRYSFISSTRLRNGSAYLTTSSATTLTFNVSAGGFDNHPGNHTLRVLSYDQNCRAFQFCWTLSVPMPSSQTVSVYLHPSPEVFSSYPRAYANELDIFYPVPYNAVIEYDAPINYTAARPKSGSNSTLFTRTWTVSPYHPSFDLSFETLGFSRSYGDSATVTNVTWQHVAERFGFIVSPPERNGTHYSRTLSWQPGWPTHRFFLGFRRRDDVNYYPFGGVGYMCLYVGPDYAGAPPGGHFGSATAVLALASFAILFAV